MPGSCLGISGQDMLQGHRAQPSRLLGEGHLLDKMEDEPLQRGVVGLRQVVQNCIDGSQLFLLLRKLWGRPGPSVLGGTTHAQSSFTTLLGCTKALHVSRGKQPTQTVGPSWTERAPSLIPFSVAHLQP